MIPDCCPLCKEIIEWKEVVNPLTTGIPIGKKICFSLFHTQGFGFYKVTYRCGKCGYENKYDYRHTD